MSRTVFRKVSLIIIFILILLVIALLVGKVTYSYLAPTIDPDRTLESEVTASGDTLIFTKGNNLSLSATTDNFKTGGTNISDTTNPKVKLVSSSKTNNASSTYYVGVYIPSNTFSYTTTTSTPELILTIKDENGANVTSVTGLTYVTQNNVSGFDITGKSGLFNIKVDYPIATTSSTTGVTHTWTFTLTFINLSTDQSVNENAKIDIDVYVQRKKIKTTVADSCSNGDNLATCIKNLSDSSKVEFTNIYKHDTNLTNGANDNSYRYAGGDYVLTSKATNAGLTTVITATNSATNGVINFYCNGSKSYVGATCGSSQTHYYTLQYDSSNTQYETYSAALAKAVTDGYLTKDNVKNFVCFGSDATPCPTANLYRIIGVFGSQVKLIKWDYATSAMLGTNGDFSQQSSYFFSGEQGESPSSNALYYWNSANLDATYNATSKYNVWSYSQLNTINLNTNYITYLNNQNSKWSQKIATTTWKVGGNTYANIATSPMNTAYQNEIMNPSTDLSEQYRTYSAKIGLMYVSDYGYAASPTYWTYSGYDTVTTDYRAAKSNNWLYGGGWDWTISRGSGHSCGAFGVDRSGSVIGNRRVNNDFAVRPVFYLTSSTSYVSGSGSASEPIRLN